MRAGCLNEQDIFIFIAEMLLVLVVERAALSGRASSCR